MSGVPAEAAGPAPEVVDAPGARRYEARIGGELVGIAEYRLEPGRVVFTHTEVEPALRGRGIAGALVRAALDDTARRGLAVVPRCRYVAAWIRRNPGYGELVARAPGA